MAPRFGRMLRNAQPGRRLRNVARKIKGLELLENPNKLALAVDVAEPAKLPAAKPAVAMIPGLGVAFLAPVAAHNVMLMTIVIAVVLALVLLRVPRSEAKATNEALREVANALEQSAKVEPEKAEKAEKAEKKAAAAVPATGKPPKADKPKAAKALPQPQPKAEATVESEAAKALPQPRPRLQRTVSETTSNRGAVQRPAPRRIHTAKLKGPTQKGPDPMRPPLAPVYDAENVAPTVATEATGKAADKGRTGKGKAKGLKGIRKGIRKGLSFRGLRSSNSVLSS